MNLLKHKNFKLKQINFVLFVWIIFVLLPIITSEIITNNDKNNNININKNINNKNLLNSIKKYQQINENYEENDDDYDDDDIIHEEINWDDEKDRYNPAEESPTQLFARYHESYITKEVADNFKRTHDKPYTDKDYDILLQDLDMNKPNDKRKNQIYEKKYFDYLPAEYEEDEQINNKSDNSESDDDSIRTRKQNYHEIKRINSRRMKRDLKTENDKIKREAAKPLAAVARDRRYTATFQVYPQPNYYLPSQQQQQQQLLQPYPAQSSFSNKNPNNPWDNRFYGPYNYYLPVPPQNIPLNIYNARPQQPTFQQYPNANTHYNPAFPPMNPPANMQVINQRPDLGDRFGAEDDRVIWDIQPNNGDQNSIFNAPATAAPVTRRPASSLIRGENNRNNNNRNPNQTQRPNSINQATQRPIFQQTTRRPSPPLIHGDTQQQQQQPTRRPAPSLIRGNNNNNNNNAQSAPEQPAFVLAGSSSNNRLDQDGGRQQQQQQQNNRNKQQQQEQQAQGPSRCVWGIVSCCQRGNLQIRYNCFEQLGCGGAFWDLNPCSDDILQAALEETNRYFD